MKIPLPDTNSQWTNGHYRVVVPYWKFLADLTANGDTNWFTRYAHRYLIAKGASDASGLNWDDERKVQWLVEAEAEHQKLIKFDKRSRLGRSTTLVPRRDVHASSRAYRR